MRGFSSVWRLYRGLSAAPGMRGRVMSLWFVAFQGSTPIGGPIIGWVMSWAGARAGLGVGGATCLLVALLGLLAARRLDRQLHLDRDDVPVRGDQREVRTMQRRTPARQLTQPR
jgi:MFS family permease